MEKNSTSKKEISFFWAVVPFLFMIISMLFTVVVLEQAPHIPLMIGTAIAAIVAYYHGYSWQDIEEMMYKGIKLAPIIDKHIKTVSIENEENLKFI